MINLSTFFFYLTSFIKVIKPSNNFISAPSEHQIIHYIRYFILFYDRPLTYTLRGFYCTAPTSPRLVNSLSTQLKCIKPSHYQHQKVLTGHYTYMMLFFKALVLMLLTKFVPNSTYRRCITDINLFNYDAKFATMIMQICLIKHQKSEFSATLKTIGANKVPKRYWH